MREINLQQPAVKTPWGFYAYSIASRRLRTLTVLFEIGFDKKAAVSLPVKLGKAFAARALWGNACYSRPGGDTGLAALVALIGTGDDEGLVAVNLVGPNKYPMILPVTAILCAPGAAPLSAPGGQALGLEFDTLVFSFFDDLDHPTNFRWALTLHA